MFWVSPSKQPITCLRACTGRFEVDCFRVKSYLTLHAHRYTNVQFRCLIVLLVRNPYVIIALHNRQAIFFLSIMVPSATAGKPKCLQTLLLLGYVQQTPEARLIHNAYRLQALANKISSSVDELLVSNAVSLKRGWSRDCPTKRYLYGLRSGIAAWSWLVIALSSLLHQFPILTRVLTLQVVG